MAVNPYQLSNIMNSLKQGQRMSGNIQRGDRFATSKFMGQETETAQDLMRKKEKEIADILGSQSKEEKLLGGLSQGLSAGASFMNPLAGGLTSGLTSLLSSGYKKRKAEKRIGAARQASKMPSKYAKSWLGKSTKDFTGGYETQFDEMKRSLASDSDIFKSALMSGLGTYLLSGGADKMETLGAAGDMGMFSGGLDFTGAGEGALFGEGNLLQTFFKGGEESKDAAVLLAPLLQRLNYEN